MDSAQIGSNCTVRGAKQTLQMQRLVNVLMTISDILLRGDRLAETNWIKLVAYLELSCLERRFIIATLTNGADLASDRAE